MNFRELMLEQKRLVTDTSALFSISEPKSPKERAAALVDLEGLPVGWLEARVETAKGLKLPAGLKIIKLEKNPKNDNQRRCVFWWKGAYREEYFDYKLIRNVHFNTITEDAAIVFKNDVENLLYRLKDKRGKQKEFDNLIKNIEDFLKKDFTYQKLLEKLSAIEDKIRFNPNKIADSISKFEKSIFEVYDPIRAYYKEKPKKFSELAFVLPLTYNWFIRKEGEKNGYKNAFLSAKALSSELKGNSGLASSPDEYKYFSKEIVELKNKISQIEAYSDDEEWKWLIKKDDKFFEKFKIMILIQDESILNLSGFFASNIVLENSIGIFRLPTVLSIIIHEFTQGTGDANYMSDGNQSLESARNPATGQGIDGHTPIENIKKTWEDVQNQKLSLEKLSSNTDLMDFLLMNRRAYLAIGLNILLKEINRL